MKTTQGRGHPWLLLAQRPPGLWGEAPPGGRPGCVARVLLQTHRGHLGVLSQWKGISGKHDLRVSGCKARCVRGPGARPSAGGPREEGLHPGVPSRPAQSPASPRGLPSAGGSCSAAGRTPWQDERQLRLCPCPARGQHTRGGTRRWALRASAPTHSPGPVNRGASDPHGGRRVPARQPGHWGRGGRGPTASSARPRCGGPSQQVPGRTQVAVAAGPGGRRWQRSGRHLLRSPQASRSLGHRPVAAGVAAGEHLGTVADLGPRWQRRDHFTS